MNFPHNPSKTFRRILKRSLIKIHTCRRRQKMLINHTSMPTQPTALRMCLIFILWTWSRWQRVSVWWSHHSFNWVRIVVIVDVKLGGAKNRKFKMKWTWWYINCLLWWIQVLFMDNSNQLHIDKSAFIPNRKENILNYYNLDPIVSGFSLVGYWEGGLRCCLSSLEEGQWRTESHQENN